MGSIGPGRASTLTVLVQEELVEAQAAGLLADEAVHILGAMVVHGDGVLQRLHARLQAEGDLSVAHRVPGKGGDRGQGSPGGMTSTGQQRVKLITIF